MLTFLGLVIGRRLRGNPALWMAALAVAGIILIAVGASALHWISPDARRQERSGTRIGTHPLGRPHHVSGLACGAAGCRQQFPT